MVLVTIILVTLLSALGCSGRSKSVASSSPGQAVSADPFLGRWDLTLKAPDREYPSWLEIRQEEGQLKGQMVGRGGNARALPKIELSDGLLTFVSPKEEEDRKDDMVFQGRLVGGSLAGTTTGPDGTPWQWVGDRAPALETIQAPRWGKPIPLFNRKSLTAWKMDKAGLPAWTVRNGTLISPGSGPELISDSEFR
jgi:hypothetical protein